MKKGNNRKKEQQKSPFHPFVVVLSPFAWFQQFYTFEEEYLFYFDDFLTPVYFSKSSLGGLEVELCTDNSLSSASVDQILLGEMYFYGTIWTRYIYKVCRFVLYVCGSCKAACTYFVLNINAYIAHNFISNLQSTFQFKSTIHVFMIFAWVKG